MYWSKAVVGSVRVLIGPDVLVQWRGGWVSVSACWTGCTGPVARWLGQCECLLDRMYWSSGMVVGSVRVLVGPDVLVQWRARLERTVLGARYHVAVVDGRRSSTEPTGLRSSSTSTARRRVRAAVVVCVSSSSTGRRAAGRGGRGGQTTLVLRQ